ncbi:MAG: hypothetical protein FJX31_07780 [Alphaproteobacteria bacterium]|nr:hypothetical protein [Alphaproteobacteria bacterium]
MIGRLAGCLAALALLGASPHVEHDERVYAPEPATTQVVLETTMGEIVLAVETARAPVTQADLDTCHASRRVVRNHHEHILYSVRATEGTPLHQQRTGFADDRGVGEMG